ncbi:MAG: phage terminase small subunit P27 family [Actinomycetota bacterium]
MKGRKPLPTKLHVINGNPSKLKLKEREEPKPDTTIPACPRFLSGPAKWEWKRIVPELVRLGLLTQVDKAALAAYCESWAVWKKATDYLVKKKCQTYPIYDEFGQVKALKPLPQVKIANDALKQLRAFCTEFGLTPSARTRLGTFNPQEGVDPLEELMKRKRAKQ